MRYLLIFWFFLLPFFSVAQVSGLFKNLAELEPPEAYDNIHVEKVYSDSLVSSFVIWVKESVALHKHLAHSEHVYVLSGNAVMRCGDEENEIGPGDLILIPFGTVHMVEVTSEEPLKVLSIQAPEFKGKDRVFIKE